MDSSDVIEMDDDAFISMEYSECAQKGKSAMNTILELGKTLLQAAREGDVFGVIELMSKGAPFTTDWLGTSPLHLAAMNNHLDTCETLLRAGIGKDAKTKVDRTPLHFASYEGHTQIVQLLLKHNVEVDCRDMLHMTPLHWAVERQHEECARLLIQAGADTVAMSRFHKTPMSIAEELNWEHMLEIMHYAELQRSGESISSTAQAVEGIADCEEMIAPTEDATTEPDETEIADDSQIDENESFPDHMENMLPKISQNNNEDTVQMLKEHGIMMLPNDNSNTITTAVQSGRKIVLSDAGKLMLRDINSKSIEINKKPVVIPMGKGKNAKMYTMSQFLALTGQNKSLTTLTKLPANISKTIENNATKFKTLPVLKAFQINNTNKLSNDKIIGPYKGKIISLNSLTKLSGGLSDELINVKALTNQGKAKIIQLKKSPSLGKTVKIVVNKTETVKNECQTMEGISTIKSTTLPTLIDLGSMDTEMTTIKQNTEVESLKQQLADSQNELIEMRRKYELLENELNDLKSRQYVIDTSEVVQELDEQII